MSDNTQTAAARSARTTVLNAVDPLGPEDVGLHHSRHDGMPRLAGISDRHTIIISRTSHVGMACTIGREELDHVAMMGNVTLVPAGVEWTAKADGTLAHIAVTIPKASFAAASARADRPSLSITRQIRGRDAHLDSIIAEMADDRLSGERSKARWHDLTTELVDHVAESCGATPTDTGRGVLSVEEMRRINAFLIARLDQTILVDEMADVVARGAHHFPRVFRRTVGLSPYQYVLRIRLRRAREMICGGAPLAHAAIASGFADQSHFTNWVRRIYGTSPTRWVAAARDEGAAMPVQGWSD